MANTTFEEMDIALPAAETQAFPGPKSKALLDELGKYVIATPFPFALDLERCEGMWLQTVDGQRLFDWANYFGSKLIGHNHPGLYEPDYVKRLVRAANNKVANPDFLTPECLDYYRLAHRIAPVSMRGEHLEVYALNSGAEAVENLMKYFVSLHRAKTQQAGKTVGNRRFLYFENAFHGRTVFALNVTETHDPTATKDFLGFIAGNVKLPFPAVNADESDAQNAARTRESLALVESCLKMMGPEIVGILVEPIQGAGGQRVAHPEFFRGLAELAHRYDVYLGFDEVQTGIGATGKMFAIDHFDLPFPPQAVAVGKKAGVGLLYMRHPLTDIGVLDSTWGGPLVDMVRFVQEMAIVERENLIEATAQKGETLARELQSVRAEFSDLIANVRGMGLYQGFSLRNPAHKGRLQAIALQNHNLLLLGAGSDSIRTRPNLSVTEEEIKLFAGLLRAALSELRDESETEKPDGAAKARLGDNVASEKREEVSQAEIAYVI